MRAFLGAKFENGFEAILDRVGDFTGIRREGFPASLEIRKENRLREIFPSVACALFPVVTVIVGIERALSSIIICAAERDTVENYANYLGSDLLDMFHGSLSQGLARMARPDHHQNPIHLGGEDHCIRNEQRWAINNNNIGDFFQLGEE